MSEGDKRRGSSIEIRLDSPLILLRPRRHSLMTLKAIASASLEAEMQKSPGWGSSAVMFLQAMRNSGD